MSNTTSNTAELTAEQVRSILVQPLEARSKFLASGVSIFDTAGPLRLPKMGGPVTVDWTGESEEIDDTQEATFDEVTLLPSTMQSVKVIVRYSNEMARQSIVSLDSAIKARLVKDVADKIDGQFFGASGDGVTTPKGLFSYAGQRLETGASFALTLDTLHDAEALALEANVNVDALKWVLRPSDLVALRKIKQGTGSNAYVLQPDVTRSNGYTLLGKPVIVTNRVPEDHAALVDFSQIAVARDLAPSVKVLTERYAEFDEQALRVVARYDVAPLNDEAVIQITADEV